MKYCEFCGKPIEDNTICTCEEAQKKAANKQKLRKLLPFILVGVIAVLVLVSCVAFFMQPGKIDPSSYVMVAFDGFDGQGTVDLKFNINSMICEIIGEEPEFDSIEEYVKWEEKYIAIEEGLSCTYKPETPLKNGDIVTVSVLTRGEAAKRIQSKEIEFTVSDLSVLEKVDIFKDIELNVEGVSGDANAKIKRNNDSDLLRYCDFNIDPMYNLANGDSITVSITNADNLAEKFNVQPVKLTKEFMVSNLGKYASSADDIPIALVEDLANHYLEVTRSEVQDDDFFTYSEITLYGSYLYIVKEDSWYSHNNELRIYVHYDEYMDGEFLQSVYMPIVFEDVLVNADGSVDIDYEDGVVAYFTSDIEEYLEENKEDYEIIKIC